MTAVVPDDYFQSTDEKACKSPLISSASKGQRLKPRFKARHRKYQVNSAFPISPQVKKGNELQAGGMHL